MSSRKPVLTAQELEIMKILWRSGASTVRGVYEDLLERRKIAYTTVMTMMNILEQKGYLKKSQKDRAFVYQATRPQKQVIRAWSANSWTASSTARPSRCCCTWWKIAACRRVISTRSGG